MKRVMFISSTGGHLHELLSMQRLFSKYQTCIVCENDATAKRMLEGYTNTFFLHHGSKEQLAAYLWVFPYNVVRSLYLLWKCNPHIIVSTGAHTAVPMCYLGKLFGKKIIYIETIANVKTKSVSGKLVYPIADLFIVQWESMLACYPNAIYGGQIDL